MATDVFQLLFASSFAAVFASAFVTCTTSLTYAFCCAALGAGIVEIALAWEVRGSVALAGLERENKSRRGGQRGNAYERSELVVGIVKRKE